MQQEIYPKLGYFFQVYPPKTGPVSFCKRYLDKIIQFPRITYVECFPKDTEIDVQPSAKRSIPL